RIKDLLAVASGGVITRYSKDVRAMPESEGFGKKLDQRVGLYEFFQAFSMQVERLDVVADGSLGPRFIADLADLPRLRIKVNVAPGQTDLLKGVLGRLGVLRQLEFVEDTSGPSDVVAMGPRTIASLTHMAPLRARFLVAMDGEDAIPDKIIASLESQGF